MYDPVKRRTLSSDWEYPRTIAQTHVTQKAYMLTAQARYFDGRLIFAGGLRRDGAALSLLSFSGALAR